MSRIERAMRTILDMFTGIIERSVRVLGVADGPAFRRLTIPKVWNDVAHGESIAINGACLTIAELAPDSLHFDVIAETLQKTNLGSLKPGDEVHVERAMRIGDRFDGHFVQGHVDGTAIVVSQRSLPGEWRTRLRLPTPLAKYLVPKGSIAVDGISLTLAAIEGNEFEVALIPTTTSLTRLAQKPEGSRCNIECDMLTKTIVTVLEQRGSLPVA
jgi:riboflavin synthase